MSTPNEFESELAAAKAKYMDINDFDSALRTRPDTGAIYDNKIILGWVLDTFDLAFKEGYERGKAETVQCPCCGEAFTIGPGTETYVTQTEKELTEARRTLAEYEHECETINEMRAERDQARAEIERLQTHLRSAQLGVYVVNAEKERDELRSLAARMAEALKGVILEIKKEYGDSLKYLVSNVARNAYLDAGKALAEYEAFERENKG